MRPEAGASHIRTASLTRLRGLPSGPPSPPLLQVGTVCGAKADRRAGATRDQLLRRRNISAMQLRTGVAVVWNGLRTIFEAFETRAEGILVGLPPPDRQRRSTGRQGGFSTSGLPWAGNHAGETDSAITAKRWPWKQPIKTHRVSILLTLTHFMVADIVHGELLSRGVS